MFIVLILSSLVAVFVGSALTDRREAAKAAARPAPDEDAGTTEAERQPVR
ncbi:hypothetical protein ACFXP3_24560 [Streptomyces sp. NPDC059096]